MIEFWCECAGGMEVDCDVIVWLFSSRLFCLLIKSGRPITYYAHELYTMQKLEKKKKIKKRKKKKREKEKKKNVGSSAIIAEVVN